MEKVPFGRSSAMEPVAAARLPPACSTASSDNSAPRRTTPVCSSATGPGMTAVYDLGDGTAAVSTTDFFVPIVDDPHAFGRIAAANAISDVYAMGGTPLMAIAILGWPVDKLDPEVAGRVLEKGALHLCRSRHSAGRRPRHRFS